jgi:hypothetical protein
MYKPDKNTQKLKELIEDEFRVKGYIRWPFVEAFLKEICEQAQRKEKANKEI